MKIILSILLVCFAFSVNAVPLHEGFIIVELGSLDSIKEQIIEHASITRKEIPRKIQISLWKKEFGTVVYFPEGTTTYDFINLLSWLHYPPENPNVGYSKGWVTASTTGKKYYLTQDEKNKRGDTYIGATENGDSVRIYLPEARMWNISEEVKFVSPPLEIKKLGKADVTFTVEIDVQPFFGNVQFVTTDPKDSEWWR